MKKFLFLMRSAAILACVIGLGVSSVHADDNLFGGDPASSNDSADVKRLFGEFQAEEEKKVEEAPKRVLPPFEGNYKVLISRPIYAVYDEAGAKTKWISALGELYTHYKVGAFPRTHAFTMEQVSGVLPNSRDYARRFNRQSYIDAAKKLGATHLIYQEYQPQKGNKTRFAMELYWLAEGATVEKASIEIIHSDFEGGLNICMAKIAEAMDKGAKGSASMGVTLFGKDMKTLEAFGNALADEGKFTRENSAAAYAAVEKILQKNSGLAGFQYAGALLAGRAEDYAKAVKHIETVISKSKDYPALQLRLAEYQRGAERYSEAMRAAETASRSPALKTPAAIEMAAIHQGQGNADRALSEYNAIVQSGDADGRVFFRLALLSIQMGRVGESEDYLRRAEESGFALDESEYLDLGEAYGKAGGYEEKAIEFIKRGMGVKQSSEDGWKAIAEIHKRTGNSQLEAEAYVNVFKINMHGNSQRLKMAGEIYEKLGMTDKAKDAYSLFIDRKFSDKDVALNLANLYYNEDNKKNCAKIEVALRGFDTIPEAMKLFEDCNIKRRKVVGNVEAKKLSPLMFTLRISGGVLLAGGVAGGLIINGVVIPDLADKYNGWPGNPHEAKDDSDAKNFDKVQKLRKDIESNMMLRDMLYVAAGVGLGCFAVTFFIP